ncbi:MAG TPA: disulfide isomerase, partial [Telluria sp.]|nr:disulfide isomerase [Telluria sp.]
LIDAGLADDSERVLLAALPESHSPYYFMHTLAGIAKRRGDAPAAADWYERAWQSAPGQATRIQWGATWLAALVELVPNDTPRIERAAHALLELVESVPDAGSQRNRTQLGRIRDSLARWQGVAANAPALARAVDAILA